jgi:hypothetical protein
LTELVVSLDHPFLLTVQHVITVCVAQLTPNVSRLGRKNGVAAAVKLTNMLTGIDTF